MAASVATRVRRDDSLKPVNAESALAVVTVAYSSGSHLDRFLSSLTVASDRPMDVVIADNGSTDGAPEEADRKSVV